MGEAPAVMPTVFDLDDFSLDNHRLDRLDALRAHHGPGFKVTLFTVPFPARPDPNAQGCFTIAPEAEVVDWLRWVKDGRPWLEYALHGWHHLMLEARSWTRSRTVEALRWAEATGLFVRVFRAPHWEVGSGVYDGVMHAGWTLADHPRNQPRRPAGLRLYLLDEPRKVHGHIQDIGSNGLAEAWGAYMAMQPPFAFVSEEIGQ